MLHVSLVQVLRLGMLQAKILSKVAPAGSSKGQLFFNTSYYIIYGISVQELLALKKKYWPMLYTE